MEAESRPVLRVMIVQIDGRLRLALFDSIGEFDSVEFDSVVSTWLLVAWRGGFMLFSSLSRTVLLYAALAAHTCPWSQYGRGPLELADPARGTLPPPSPPPPPLQREPWPGTG